MVILQIELTVPYYSRENLKNARARNSQKSSYLELPGDQEAKGYSASLVTCEISSLGHSLPLCLKVIHDFFPSVHRSSIRAMFDAAEKIVISLISRYSWLAEISFGQLRSL